MNKIYKLHANWITGFVDGEGCFYVSLRKNIHRNTGWRIDAGFQIKLHVKDKDLILQIKSFFGNIGTIVVHKNMITFQVRSIQDIVKVIIPHFEKYPLITQKNHDFLIWKEISMLIYQGEHLNKEGFIKIVNLRASLNKGLSEELKILFPKIKVIRSNIKLPINLDYNWLAGFFSGEGCFHVYISKYKKRKEGYNLHLLVYVNQHSRDEMLINLFKNVLKCGYTFNHSSGSARVFSVTKFKDIYNKIIPIFKKYKIRGVKSLDFEDFCKVAELINKKAHITVYGLNKIKEIKSGMNLARYKK